MSDSGTFEERLRILREKPLLGYLLELFDYFAQGLDHDGVYLYTLDGGLPHRLAVLPEQMASAEALYESVSRTLFTSPDDWENGYAYAIELRSGWTICVDIEYGSGTLGCCHNMRCYLTRSIRFLLPHLPPRIVALFSEEDRALAEKLT